MNTDTRFCVHCHYAITGLEFRMAVVSFPCPDCGEVTGNHLANDFYQYGSLTHHRKWQEWVSIPEEKRMGRGPLPFPYQGEHA